MPKLHPPILIPGIYVDVGMNDINTNGYEFFYFIYTVNIYRISKEKASNLVWSEIRSREKDKSGFNCS